MFILFFINFIMNNIIILCNLSNIKYFIIINNDVNNLVDEVVADGICKIFLLLIFMID